MSDPLTFTDGPLAGAACPENLPVRILVALDDAGHPARVGDVIAAQGTYLLAGHRYEYTGIFRDPKREG